VGRILGEKWKELSNKERKPYEEIAKKDDERYKNAVEAFAETGSISRTS
jgi:upstream-binding transcription factor